jgi:hypothetical protein
MLTGYLSVGFGATRLISESDALDERKLGKSIIGNSAYHASANNATKADKE